MEADAPGHMVSARYLERLTAGDLRMLADATGADAVELARRPGVIERLVAHPDTHRRLFARTHDAPFVAASPFLAFAVLVHRAARDLRDASFTLDRVGHHTRVPIFENRVLADFLGVPEHRLFLADLLASFTHVASGAFYTRGRRRWHAHHYNELDPIRLASLLDVVDDRERAAVLRRMGDASLFLTGVFPDHSATWLSSSLRRDRLRRVLRVSDREWAAPRSSDDGSLRLLVALGRRSYRAAASSTASAGSMGVVASVADRFNDARRILNHLTDRYLFPIRSQWFPALN